MNQKASLTNVATKNRCTGTLFVLGVALFCAGAVVAEDFDGSKPLMCEPLQGHDCLPTESTCKPLERKSDKVLNFGIDVTGKTVRSPFRTELLPIQSVSKNTQSLVLQGTSLEAAWTATVHRTTGKLAVAIADRAGAYIVFGQCKVAGTTGEKPK
jgi:hypothetical protein